MDKSGWTVEDEKAYQQLALRRTSQMPVLPAGSSGAMTDASRRRADDAGFEFESDWEVGSNLMEPLGGIEDLATKALLPAGVTSMTMWGKTKFAFGKYEKEKANYQTVFDKDTSYVSWCRKHLTEDSSKGPALDWSRYIKAETWWTAKLPMCPSMQGPPCVESFVSDGIWDIGWIYERFHSMWTAEILEKLSNWMGVCYTALWLRAQQCIFWTSFGRIYLSKSGWITDGYIAQIAIDSCDGIHLKRGCENFPLGVR